MVSNGWLIWYLVCVYLYGNTSIQLFQANGKFGYRSVYICIKITWLLSLHIMYLQVSVWAHKPNLFESQRNRIHLLCMRRIMTLPSPCLHSRTARLNIQNVWLEINHSKWSKSELMRAILLYLCVLSFFPLSRSRPLRHNLFILWVHIVRHSNFERTRKKNLALPKDSVQFLNKDSILIQFKWTALLMHS